MKFQLFFSCVFVFVKRRKLTLEGDQRRSLKDGAIERLESELQNAKEDAGRLESELQKIKEDSARLEAELQKAKEDAANIQPQVLPPFL